MVNSMKPNDYLYNIVQLKLLFGTKLPAKTRRLGKLTKCQKVKFFAKHCQKQNLPKPIINAKTAKILQKL